MTTIGAMVMTPLMGKLLLGQVVPINAAAIAMSTVQVVLAPLLVGMAINAGWPNFVKSTLPFTPVLGVIKQTNKRGDHHMLIGGNERGGMRGSNYICRLYIAAGGGPLARARWPRRVRLHQTILWGRCLSDLCH